MPGINKMRRPFKIAILMLSHLTACAVGVFGCIWYLQQSMIEANSMMNSMMVLSRHQAYVKTQRTLGNDDDYRNALLTFSNALDQARSYKDSFFDDKLYYTDKTLTYIRLARLQNKIGNQQESQKYENLALSFCSKLHWKDCTYERLVNFSKRLEQNSILFPSEIESVTK